MINKLHLEPGFAVCKEWQGSATTNQMVVPLAVVIVVRVEVVVVVVVNVVVVVVLLIVATRLKCIAWEHSRSTDLCV